MIEMEIKAFLRDEVCVRAKLSQCGCQWKDTQYQVDTIYVQDKVLSDVNTPIFHIRRQGSLSILTLKILESDLDTATELELEISDALTMQDILYAIGFKELVRVAKHRDTTHFDGFNICIDKVENLGTFIEIERVESTMDNQQTVYDGIMHLLVSLGISKSDVTKKKYYKMILDKQANNA